MFTLESIIGVVVPNTGQNSITITSDQLSDRVSTVESKFSYLFGGSNIIVMETKAMTATREKWIVYIRLSNGDELYLCDHLISGGYTKNRTFSQSLALRFDSYKEAVKRIGQPSSNWHVRRIR